MQKNTKRNFTITATFFILFSVFTILVMFVDVRAIGPYGSSVGLAGVNQYVWNITGVNMIWYHITDWLGFAGIFTALGFSVLGLIQLIKRKSFKKVDADIYILGAFYILVIALYCFFETFIVNYRPVLINGYLEASYPSTHTMIICSIMGTAILQWRDRIHNKPLQITLIVLSIAVIFITVAGRLISGVHWFSDIIGGLFLSGALVMLYYSCVRLAKDEQHTS